MAAVDLLVLGLVALSVVLGARSGQSAQVFSLGGLAAGAVAGARAAPHLLQGGERSPWLPLASLIGAFVGAVVLKIAAGALARALRRDMPRPVRVLDILGGSAGGAAVALALAWLVAVLALQQPALGLRRAVDRSVLLPVLVRSLPTEALSRALSRFDPLPVISGAGADRLPPARASVLRHGGTRAARASVVKILGTACGVGMQGSGWVVARELVATNAHVVAGQDDTRVLAPNGQELRAQPVYVDAVNDVALLRVPSLRTPPLALARRPPGVQAVVLLGYARNGPLKATAATAGPPVNVVAPDIYRRRMKVRTVVPLRGRVEPGESGGPALDRGARVIAMIFGKAGRGHDGLAVPAALVRRALASPLRPVSTGDCLI